MMNGLKERRRERGFTLVELLVVMVILGLLASLVLPNFFGQAEKSRSKIARVQIKTLETALDAFGLDTGRYPSSQEGLAALLEQPSGMSMWDGPYLKGKLPKDPWGNDYEYSGPDDSGTYQIVCLGADGRRGGDGGDADISSAD